MAKSLAIASRLTTEWFTVACRSLLPAVAKEEACKAPLAWAVPSTDAGCWVLFQFAGFSFGSPGSLSVRQVLIDFNGISMGFQWDFYNISVRFLKRFLCYS